MSTFVSTMSTFASTMSTFTMSTCVHGAGPVRGAEAAFGSGRYQGFGAVDDVNFRTRYQFLRMGQDQVVAQKQLRLKLLSLLVGSRRIQLNGSGRCQLSCTMSTFASKMSTFTMSTFAHGAGPVRSAEAAAPQAVHYPQDSKLNGGNNYGLTKSRQSA